MPCARVNGIDLFYEIEGDGEPLLLLAGFACDHTHWDLVKPLLVDTYQVIRPDNRGAGRSTAPDSPYSMRQMADDVAALLKDHLHLGLVHVAGHSMGGQIAQELALAYPTTVRSLMLLATWAKPDALLAPVIDSWGRLALLVDPHSRHFVRIIMPWLFTELFFDTPREADVFISLWMRNRHPPLAHAVFHQSQAILQSDTAVRLSGIGCLRTSGPFFPF